MATSVGGKVIVYGGRGALGAQCVNHFKSKNWWVGSVDLRSNDKADFNVLVNTEENLPEQEEKVLKSVKMALQGVKLDAVICIARELAGVSANQGLARNTDFMWRNSVWSSVISSSIAVHHLKEGGLLTLTGATPAFNRDSGILGYGIAKAAVCQLTKSLASTTSSLPQNCVCVSILPEAFDTPVNRQGMPNSDFSTWTPLEYLSELLWKWIVNKNERPANGSLLQLVTKDNKTELKAIQG